MFFNFIGNLGRQGMLQDVIQGIWCIWFTRVDITLRIFVLSRPCFQAFGYHKSPKLCNKNQGGRNNEQRWKSMNWKTKQPEFLNEFSIILNQSQWLLSMFKFLFERGIHKVARRHEFAATFANHISNAIQVILKTLGFGFAQRIPATQHSSGLTSPAFELEPQQTLFTKEIGAKQINKCWTLLNKRLAPELRFCVWESGSKSSRSCQNWRWLLPCNQETQIVTYTIRHVYMIFRQHFSS